jgi:hypothetical protein
LMFGIESFLVSMKFALLSILLYKDTLTMN